jgi:hypothetical protein
MCHDYLRDVAHWLQGLDSADVKTRANIILSMRTSKVPTRAARPVLEKGVNDSTQ